MKKFHLHDLKPSYLWNSLCWRGRGACMILASLTFRIDAFEYILGIIAWAIGCVIARAQRVQFSLLLMEFLPNCTRLPINHNMTHACKYKCNYEFGINCSSNVWGWVWRQRLVILRILKTWENSFGSIDFLCHTITISSRSLPQKEPLVPLCNLHKLCKCRVQHPSHDTIYRETDHLWHEKVAFQLLRLKSMLQVQLCLGKVVSRGSLLRLWSTLFRA